MKSYSHTATFRPDIEGLRGIAVIIVLLFHASFELARGGYIGVDIFFVLSGYLITSGLYNGEGQGFKDLLLFYEKRARRIFPTALFILLCVFITSYGLLFREEMIEVYKAIYSALTLRSNTLARETINYFGIAAGLRPLLHYWSLAIELQFYFFFPLLFMPLKRALGRERALNCVVFCVFILFALTVFKTEQRPHRYYFATWARMWEMGMGCLAFRLSQMSTELVSNYLKKVLLGASLVGVLISTVFFDSFSNFPGLKSLIPCLSAVVILLYGQTPGLVNKFLSSKVMRFSGKISFSLYLIHQPVFAFYRVLKSRELNSFESIIALFLSFAGAYLVYSVVEKRSTSKNITTQRILYCLMIPVFFFMLYISWNGRHGDLFIPKISKEVSHILKFRKDNNPDVDLCRFKGMKVIELQKACRYGKRDGPLVIVWGDSHADQLMPELIKSLVPLGYQLLEISVSGCPPIKGLGSLTKYKKCAENYTVIQEFVLRQKAKFIILHSYWQHYIDEGKVKKLGTSLVDDLFRASLEELSNSMLTKGQRMLLIGPIPKINIDPVLFLARRSKLYGGPLSIVKLSLEQHLSDTRISREVMHKVSESRENVVFIAPYKALMNKEMTEIHANNEKEIYYRDDNHLSVTGSKKLVPLIKKALKYIP